MLNISDYGHGEEGSDLAFENVFPNIRQVAEQVHRSILETAMHLADALPQDGRTLYRRIGRPAEVVLLRTEAELGVAETRIRSLASKASELSFSFRGRDGVVAIVHADIRAPNCGFAPTLRANAICLEFEKALKAAKKAQS